MTILTTRHFSSTRQRPTTPPDGSSLQEQMNAFLATLPLSVIADVSTTAIASSPPLYIGVIIYQTGV